MPIPAIATAYDRTRIRAVRLMRGELRTLEANLNGLMVSGDTLASATWRCDLPYIVHMQNAAIGADDRSTAVQVLANWIGDTFLRCIAAAQSGSRYTQIWHIDVSGDPLFPLDHPTNGVLTLTAQAS